MQASYFLRVFFAFLYILCVFKINFLTIITMVKNCNMTLDVLKYFTMIIIYRIVQKKNFAQQTIFKCQHTVELIKQTLNMEHCQFFAS